MNQEKEKISLEDIKSSLDNLSEKIDKQEERINRLEKEREVFSSQTQKGPQFPEDKLGGQASTSAGMIKKEKKVKEKVDWEEKLGGQWFAKIGIAVLVIGIALFLKYAFDNNWIGETGRVVIGLFIGLALLVWGEKIIKKFFLYGQIISGGGLVILYVSIFAAFSFYELISASLAFPAMILVTVLGVVLSLRYSALSLLAVVIVGGFATPFLISTGENQQIILFSYVLILDLAVLAVSVFKRWHLVNVLAFLGTIITAWAWLLRFYDKEQLLSTILFFTLFFLVYSLSSLIYNLINREKSTGVEQVLTLLAAFFYFSAIYGLLDQDYYSFLGFFAVILGVYYFLWAYFVRQFTPEDKNLYHFLAFLTIGFITLSIPIEFKKYTITMIWAVEAVLLIGLAYKTREKAIYALGTAVSGLAVARVLFWDATLRLPAQTPALFNKRFVSFLAVIASLYLIAWLFKKIKGFWQESEFLPVGTMILVFIVLANFLTLFTGSQEIVHYHENKIRNLNQKQNELFTEQKRKLGEPMPVYETKEYQLIREKQRNIEYQKSISLSVFWMIYALILLVIGFVYKHRFVRVGGLVLLVLSILKLFFVDLWHLGSLYRIISSLSLGAVLLLISFAYQKYKDKLKEII